MGHVFLLCKKVEVSWFFAGDLKSEGICRAYCEYGVKGEFGVLAVKVWSWSSAPSRFCQSWRGSSDCAWSGVSQKLLLWELCSCELSKGSHGSSPALLGNSIVCVHHECVMDSSVPGSGRDGSSPGSCHHGLALSVVGWEQCAGLLWTSQRLWTKKYTKICNVPLKSMISLFPSSL